MQAGLREQYEALCESAGPMPLYNVPWWLDAVCGHRGWEILVSKNNHNGATCYLPVFRTRIRGLHAVINPPLTQWLIPVTSGSDHAGFVPDLLDQLSGYSILDTSFKLNKEPKELSPEYAINYKYSYIIPATNDLQEIRKKYNEGLRRNLKEAEGKYVLQHSDDVLAFLELYNGSYRLRGAKPPAEIVKCLPDVFGALKDRGQGELLFAFYRGKPIAGILTAKDQNTSYYLTGGRTSTEDGASAHALLLDHAILEAQKNGHIFDFEGSMHPGIANFFQSFGAVPRAYYRIRKYKGLGRVWGLMQE